MQWWDAEEADPRARGARRGSRPGAHRARGGTGRGVQVLQVVHPDRDEHEVGIDQRLGLAERDGSPGGDAANAQRLTSLE